MLSRSILVVTSLLFCTALRTEVRQNSPDAPSKKQPQGGQVLLSSALDIWSLTGKEEGGATVERVEVKGQPFKEALLLTTTRRPANIWNCQIAASPNKSITKGDVLWVRFRARAIKGQAETGEAQTQFVLERGAEPYTKAIEYTIGIPREWKTYELPFVAVEDLAPSLVKVNFRLGMGAQSFEIADFTLKNFGKTLKLTDLPRTKGTYAGMEPQAAWRREAEARIEKLRKGDFAVTVVDATGKPVRGAAISLRMTRHAFGFGTAVSGETLPLSGPDGDRYRDFITKYCSVVVMENELKWPYREARPEVGEKAVEWLQDHRMPLRGHNLIWPSWRNSPERLQKLKDDKVALKKAVEDHIRETALAFRGKLVEWDVVNEPYDNHDITDILGRDSLIRWFQLAREADPKARLFLNDYPPLDGSATANPHLNHFYDTIRYLKEGGAPIGGIGFQCHFGSEAIPPVRLLSGLDRFGKFGLPIALTEFDINTRDEELQAAYTCDFLIATFSHPAVHSILIWGFWEGRHWLPEAALYRRDWSIKPNGQVWLDLVTKRWWTQATGTTDNNGRYALRGFYGDYEITVDVAGQKKVVPVSFTKSGSTLSVKL